MTQGLEHSEATDIAVQCGVDKMDSLGNYCYTVCYIYTAKGWAQGMEEYRGTMEKHR